MSYNPLFVGSQALGSSVALVTNYTNASGTPIPQGTPCSASVSGLISPTDVSSPASVRQFVGYAQTRIGANASGPVISGGRLQILSGFSFSVGDSIYMGLSGTLINQKPDYGVAGFQAGDTVVFCGVIVKNEINPSDQDLQILTQVIGEL